VTWGTRMGLALGGDGGAATWGTRMGLALSGDGGAATWGTRMGLALRSGEAGMTPPPRRMGNAPLPKRPPICLTTFRNR
jgi:hypothetical protein